MEDWRRGVLGNETGLDADGVPRIRLKHSYTHAREDVHRLGPVRAMAAASLLPLEPAPG